MHFFFKELCSKTTFTSGVRYLMEVYNQCFEYDHRDIMDLLKEFYKSAPKLILFIVGLKRDIEIHQEQLPYLWKQRISVENLLELERTLHVNQIPEVRRIFEDSKRTLIKTACRLG
jgi:hypothetical protein